MSSTTIPHMCYTTIFVTLLYLSALVACSPEMRALQDRLLSNYNKFMRPVLRESDPVKVSVSMYISYIQGLNLLAQTLAAGGFMDIVWRDEYLVWQPEENGNITALLLSETQVWLPDVTIENDVNGVYFFGNDKIQVHLRCDGTVTWQPTFQTETGCKVNIYKYPFDTQECALEVIPWMTTRELATISYLGIEVDAEVNKGEFLVVDAQVEEDQFDVSFGSEPLEQGIFKIYLQRRYMFYLLSSIIPLAAFSLLSPLALLVPAESGEKITLSVTVLLANLVFMGTLSDSIPRVGDSVSVFVVYASLQIIVSFATVIANVVLLCLSHRCSNNSKQLETATHCNLPSPNPRIPRGPLTNASSAVLNAADIRSSAQAKLVCRLSSMFSDVEPRDTSHTAFDFHTPNVASTNSWQPSDESSPWEHGHQIHSEEKSGDSTTPIGRPDKLCCLAMFLAVGCVNVVCFVILIA